MKLSRQQLYSWVWSEPLSTIAGKVGWSDRGIRKVCDRRDIPTPGRGYWRRLEVGLSPITTPLDNPSDNRATEIVVTDPEIIAKLEDRSVRMMESQQALEQTKLELARKVVVHAEVNLGNTDKATEPLEVSPVQQSEDTTGLSPTPEYLTHLTSRQAQFDASKAFLLRLEQRASTLSGEPAVQAILGLWILTANDQLGVDPASEIIEYVRGVSRSQSSPPWMARRIGL